MSIRLSDDEFSIVLAAPRPLAGDLQDQFMSAVAHALEGREIGVGAVARVCRELQRYYFHPPDLGNRGTRPKYR
jgi:hypothetical protein